MTARNINTNRQRPTVMYSGIEGMHVRLPISEAHVNLTVPSTIDPFAESSTQEFPLGTELWYGDRKFRYALNGGSAITAGKLCQSVVPLAGHIDEVIGSPAVGDTTIDFTPAVVTTDDLAANDLADGYICVQDETGEGHLYRIKSHPAITGGGSGVLTLYDPILVAPAAAATATILHNRWRKVIIHPAPQTAAVCGWTVCALTASYYGWLQTHGTCCALIDGTVVIGQEVRPSEDDEGAVAALDYDEATEADRGGVGTVAAVVADQEYGIIYANIAGG